MGTEILILFVLAPLALVVFDIVRLVQKRDAKKHIALLLMGIAGLGCLTVSTALAGYHPMQGFIIASVFYLPIYGAFWLVFTVIENVIHRSERDDTAA